MTKGLHLKIRDKSAWEDRSKAWASTMSKGLSQDDTLNQILISEAGIKPGQKILDIASGSGNPAVSAAVLMNGEGTITLTDLSEGMLKNARDRANTLNIKNMRYCTADMNRLPFPNDEFDLASCRFGIMFPENKIKAALEAKRVLKPGGKIVYMVWDEYDKNPPFFVPRRAVANFFSEDEPPIPPRHSMSQPGTLQLLLEDSGFERILEKEVGYDNKIYDLDAYITNGLKRSHAEKIADLSVSQFLKLKESLYDAWAPYTKDGITFVPNRARIVVGFKPLLP